MTTSAPRALRARACLLAVALVVVAAACTPVLTPRGAPVPPEPAAGRDPFDRSRPPAPDGTPLCAAWVHDRYQVVLADGTRHPTWHPPKDPVHGCAFGHEHGTDPRAFRFVDWTGWPAFGRINAVAGVDEPHPGFKVYATNDDGRGFAWMMVLHQGSASARRAQVRHHSLEVWLFRTDGTPVADVGQLADFGAMVPNCTPAELAALPASIRPLFVPDDPHAFPKRIVPVPQCASVYESWSTAFDVGGVFGGRPAFDIDNAITRVDPTDPDRVVFNTGACGPHDPAGWDSYCKGDKRTVIHPGWYARNTGPSTFTTDVYGRRDGPGRRLVQHVATGVTISRPWVPDDCCGARNVFAVVDQGGGGLYVPSPAVGSQGFEGPEYCVLRYN